MISVYEYLAFCFTTVIFFRSSVIFWLLESFINHLIYLYSFTAFIYGNGHLNILYCIK